MNFLQLSLHTHPLLIPPFLIANYKSWIRKADSGPNYFNERTSRLITGSE